MLAVVVQTTDPFLSHQKDTHKCISYKPEISLLELKQDIVQNLIHATNTLLWTIWPFQKLTLYYFEKYTSDTNKSKHIFEEARWGGRRVWNGSI